MNFRNIFIGICTLLVFGAKGQGIAGYVVDASNKETLAGVLVADSTGRFLAYTNQYGYFSIAQKRQSLKFSLLGYQPTTIRLDSNKELIEVKLQMSENNLEEVTVKENYRDNYENNITKLSLKDIKRFPSIMGEKDLIKVVQTLPGVKRMVEGGSGFSVRGGGADQNLVMLDNTPIYSYNHLFGLFSMFNTDAVKDVEFIRNGISAQYGGRSSSVLNVRLKDGGLEKWQGNGSIGLLSSKICLDGPIIKNKTAVMLSARRSYLDILTKPLMPKEEKQGYVLGDYGFKLSHTFNQKSRFFLGLYHSKDIYAEERTQTLSPTLQIYAPFSLSWKNTLGYLRYVYAGKKSFTNIQAYNSLYNFDYFEKTERLNGQQSLKTNQLDYDSFINDAGLNLDQDRQLSEHQSIKFGLGILRRRFLPRSVSQTLTENGSLAAKIASIAPQQNLVAYQYAEWKQTIGKSTLITGLRSVQWYGGRWQAYLEPRLSFTLPFPKEQTLRFGYFKINQFVHLLSNTGGALPTDMWITISDKIKPQQSEQFSLGYATAIRLGASQQSIRVEVDAYYKKLQNLLMYQEGANFLNITEGLEGSDLSNWEDVLTSGKGYSQGLEFLVRKNTGKLQGSVSYTLSRTRYLFEKLNLDTWFFPKFDRLHDFNFNGSYPLNKKTMLSASYLFATGSPVTLPNTLYQTDRVTTDFKYLVTLEAPYYTGINNYRSEPYHRLDLGLAFSKKKRHFSRSWETSIFNVYAQKNPFYYGMGRKNLSDFGVLVFSPQKKSFLSIIPSVSYSITF